MTAPDTRGMSQELRLTDLIERMIAAGWRVKAYSGFGLTPTSQTWEIAWEREELKP